MRSQLGKEVKNSLALLTNKLNPDLILEIFIFLILSSFLRERLLHPVLNFD
jgi:hypothetical protein